MTGVLLIVTLYLGVFFSCTLSEQSYYTSDIASECLERHPENAGYVCEADTQSCETVAYFRAQSGTYSSLDSIANDLFDMNASAIASRSGLSYPNNTQLADGQGLYIPITCTCYGKHSSQNVTYNIQLRDTFSAVANQTYEGLTTCQAIQAANPALIPTNLVVNQRTIVPIRCACPSATQKQMGVVSLVTYPVADGDDIKSVVQRFGIVEQQFLAANSIPNTSSLLFAATTVLLPFLVKPSIPPNATSISSAPSPSVQVSSSSASSKTGIYVGVAVAFVIVLCAAVIVFVWWKRGVAGGKPVLPSSIPPVPAKPSSPLLNMKFNDDMHGGVIEFPCLGKFTRYSLKDIEQATQNFSPVTLIKGSVYRGVVNGQAVAVKIVTRDVSEELQILKKVHHGNLITLVGYCIVPFEQSYLVYEYAENGSLSDWLHDDDDNSMGSNSCILTWNQRLQVSLDVATALEYIHKYTYPSYVHKDVKSSNILLDSKFRGKLANFALAKELTEDAVTRHIMGTQGYMAPEYLSGGLISSKIDVFAFGVVLLEILSGEQAVIKDGHGKGRLLSGEVAHILDNSSGEKERLNAWMDPHLQNMYPLDCAYRVALLAKSCVGDDPSARPDMRDVAYTLAKALEISLEWDGSSVLEVYTDNSLEAR
ncbi:hypothetical protein KP509_19G010700 [Ceratopteris richardii]|uniref:Uncharacterized protein n=3 Tax=Ceratopteris richardii TaxID=49495 RepID=A0A8T2SHS5_CERRI|nr:hypothetical protein KP509_19G010700 [Ceratopteris richardii]KAH7351698.1 hypothetical protein KP509_19G010700 [Ceratopteris richardii]